MVRVGIPRALLYYEFYPLWRAFFDGVGGEVITSQTTQRDMVAAGSARLVADTCLPVKVFCGHILSLMDQCDYIFVPSIRSIEDNVYNCSKFLGLPDVVKAVIPNCPPLLDVDIDINKGQKEFYAAIYSVARPFTWNPFKVKKAAQVAWQTHLTYQDLMRRQGLTPPQAIARLFGEKEEPEGPQSPPVATIAVIGHPYTLYDEYINHRLIRRLRGMRVRVLTTEMATEGDLDAGVARLVGRPYWTFEDEVVGAGGHYLHQQVDGVISVVSFGCGPDSVMIDLLQRYAKRQRTVPFMSLTIDEHTAEAGLVTRLEAFLDMLMRRKRRQACA